MESPYFDEQDGEYYAEYYSPNLGGSYYDSYDVQDLYANNDFETCAGMEEHPSSKWKELLEICVNEANESRKMTNQRLYNLERNTSLLEQGLASLVEKLAELELNIGVLATALGGKHTPGTFPSPPEINLKGNSHAVQLRSGTTYQPPRGIRSRRQEERKGDRPVEPLSTAEHPQRSAASLPSGPPYNPQPTEPESDSDTELPPAVDAPPRSGSLPEKQPSNPISSSSATIPYPQRLKSKKLDAQFTKFLEAISKVHINIPLVETLQQMPNYAKFLKDVVTKKRKLGMYETVGLTETCSAILQKGLPTKHKDPGSFTLSCVLGNNVEARALCDLGASVNLMHLSFYMKLDIDNLKPTSITLQMADRTTTSPSGIVEDALVRVGEFIFPADFVVLDMHEDKKVPLILGRPFLDTGGAMIDVQKGKLTLQLHNESITFNIYDALKFHGKE